MTAPPPISRAGLRLYAELPEEYRYRDNPIDGEPGDLEAFLHGFGLLLDRTRATLEQLHADSFPQGDEDGRPAQGWVLAYIADLLGAELIAPDTAARALELEKAVSWRQGKGTQDVVDGIGDVFGGSESVLVEGWTRVLTTPRLDLPPLASDIEDPAPLPGAPDLSLGQRAVRLPEAETDPLTLLKPPFVDGDPSPASYRIAHRGGVPIFPGSYEDRAPRTPDLRAPGHDAGHAHPRAAVAHLRPPLGFFAPDGDRADGQGPIVQRVYEDLNFTAVTVPAGVACSFARCAIETLTVEADAGTPAAPRVVLRDCLIDTLDAPAAFVQAEYVTVLTQASVGRLWASDCLFADGLTLDADGLHCVRYSRVPTLKAVDPEAEDDARATTNTDARPMFLTKGDVGLTTGSAEERVGFGERGCGVLHPATPKAISAGAEDHGEMGAYHHAYHLARLAAMTRKLADHAPLGIDVVPTYDPRLLHRPPKPAGDAGP